MSSAFRIGHGYDIHRLQPGGELLMAGIIVAENISPIAHSDGDVVKWHALLDKVAEPAVLSPLAGFALTAVLVLAFGFRIASEAPPIPDKVVAIPGSHTTASLLLRMYMPEEPALIEVAFDKIPQAVLDGQADLGLLIHEGQITHQKMGLVKVLDFGEMWLRDTGLPLPLGVNVMRRDLGDAMHRALSQGLRESIAWAHANVDEAVEYAMRYGRGIDKETATRFVLMYVNDYTVKLGAEGLAALEQLFKKAYEKKLIPE